MKLFATRLAIGLAAVVAASYAGRTQDRPDQENERRPPATLVLDKAEATVLVPSPNGKRLVVLAALKGFQRKGSTEEIIVVSDQGDVVARVPVKR